MFNTRIVSLLLTASLWSAPTWATTYPLPPAGSRLIGELEDYIVQPDEHLERIGKHTQIGFLALLEANPGVDPYLPLAIPSYERGVARLLGYDRQY